MTIMVCSFLVYFDFMLDYVNLTCIPLLLVYSMRYMQKNCFLLVYQVLHGKFYFVNSIMYFLP